MIPGTPAQFPSVVIRPVFVQSWENGSVCGERSAETDRTSQPLSWSLVSSPAAATISNEVTNSSRFRKTVGRLFRRTRPVFCRRIENEGNSDLLIKLIRAPSAVCERAENCGGVLRFI